MTAKDYLERIRKYDTKIDSLRRVKLRVRDRATAITSTIRKECVSGTGYGDRVGSAVVEVADLEREIDQAVRRYTMQIRNAIHLISKLDNPDHIKLLTMRYIEHTTFDQIASEMGRSVQGIFYMHGRALDALEQVMNRSKARNKKGEKDERTDEPYEYAEH